MHSSSLYEVDFKAFSERFMQRETFAEVFELAKTCRLSVLNNRLTAWRLFLKVLQLKDSPAQWVEAVERSRHDYAELRRAHFSPDYDLKSRLSSTESVIKLRPNLEHLFEIIKVWTEANTTELKEEMVDILCIVMFVVNCEAFLANGTDEAQQVLHCLNNPEHVASDAFFIFAHIMKTGYSSLWTAAKLGKKGNEMNLIELKCKRIYDFYLKSLDPELYNFLEYYKIPTASHVA
jgi:hypothetical protein